MLRGREHKKGQRNIKKMEYKNDKKIEQEISAVFNAFFQLILSSDEIKSSEIISDNELEDEKNK